MSTYCHRCQDPVDAQGPLDSAIQDLRQAAASAYPGCRAGRSTLLIFLLEGRALLIKAKVGPIAQRSMASHDTASDATLQECFVAAWKRWSIRLARASKLRALASGRVGGIGWALLTFGAALSAAMDH